VVGGVRLNDPGSDLALCLALASAALDAPVHSDLVALGEVGLGGEIRHVTHLERRVVEAERMGFRHVLIPANSKAPDMQRAKIIRAATIADAISLAL
jgi:DNA repair protein RadA/Sms